MTNYQSKTPAGAIKIPFQADNGSFRIGLAFR